MKIVLAGGCFWCTEAAYQIIRGVRSVKPGYAGGHTLHPTYEDVVQGDTGHAEAIEVDFDESVISFKNILHIFWTIHNPTSLNRQGADVGTQYRSAIFYSDNPQKRIAEKSMQEAQKLWDKPIVTTLEPLTNFYEAEPYHRDYFANHPEQAYCQIVINPKLAKLRKLHQELLKHV